MYKIKSPESNKLIYLGGSAYDDLIKNGYTEEELNALPKIKTNIVPKSPKIKNYVPKTHITLPDEIILEEILLKQNPENFMAFCQSNVHYNKLCKQNNFWKKLYLKRYGEDGIDYINHFGSYYELYKYKYGCDILNKAFGTNKSFGDWFNLKTLDLASKKLTSLPKELGQLQSLQRLYLSNNKLTSLPKELGQLQSLEELYMSNNKLTSIPKELGQLQSLKFIYLRNNQLTSLPEAFIKS